MTAVSPLLNSVIPLSRAEVATFAPRRPDQLTPPKPPHLRAIPGGRSLEVRRRRRTFRRRRVSVLAFLIVFVVVVGASARTAGALFDGLRSTVVVDAGATGTSGASPADAPTATGSPTAAADPRPLVAGGTYVVQSGDTLWSIAQRLRPGSDPRAVVDALSSRVPGGALEPGQRLDVSDLGVDG
jgi:hypothetical protein